MYRKKYRRKNSNYSLLILFLIVILVAAFVPFINIDANNIIYILITAIILTGISCLFILWYTNYLDKKKLMSTTIDDIDHMSGWEFEEYLGELLKSRGFNIVVTKKTGDFGADIIARKDHQRISIQAKCYHHPVDNAAIQQTVASIQHYSCNSCMVITSNYFTKAAKILAQENDCVLIDRDKLIDWMYQFQKVKKQEEDQVIESAKIQKYLQK